MQAVDGADVSAIGLNGVPIGGELAVSDSSGAFTLCVASGQQFTTQIMASTYVTSYLEDL